MQELVTFSGVKIPAFDKSIVFASKSEAVCAILLEKYCNWKAVKGVTFQVPVGRKHLDFVVGNTVVEFHPIVLNREFINTGAWRAISDTLRQMHTSMSGPIYYALKAEMGAQYWKARRAVLDASPTFKNHDLVVARTDQEFCRLVKRFARVKPSKDEIFLEFRQLHADLFKPSTVVPKKAA